MYRMSYNIPVGLALHTLLPKETHYFLSSQTLLCFLAVTLNFSFQSVGSESK